MRPEDREVIRQLRELNTTLTRIERLLSEFTRYGGPIEDIRRNMEAVTREVDEINRRVTSIERKK